MLILRVFIYVCCIYGLGGELLGKKMYKNIKDIEHNVEGAVVVVAAKFAVQSAKDLMEKGAKWITIITGGFAESKTAEGKEAQVCVRLV